MVPKSLLEYGGSYAEMNVLVKKGRGFSGQGRGLSGAESLLREVQVCSPLKMLNFELSGRMENENLTCKICFKTAMKDL